MLPYLFASCTLPMIWSQGHVSALVDMRVKNWTSTALTLLMLLFYHNLLRIYYSKPSRDFASHEIKPRENGGVDSGFAYVFYATADLYACSTLVNIQRLRDLNSTIPIHVLTSDFLSVPYMDALQASNVTVHIEETPQVSTLLGGYYEDCLLKLLAFKMHKLDPSLRRVLIFDSDQLILKHFDNLFFDLPNNVDLAAPRAYWLPQEQAYVSSAFMMISLSDRLWEQVNQTFPSDGLAYEGPARADMQVVNDELGDSAMILSGEYVTLNSHWEDWNIPIWFHPEGSPLLNRTFSEAPDLSEYMENASVEPQAGLNAQDIRGQDSERPTPRFPEKSEIFQQLLQLHEYASIVHFTGLGKPWTYTVQDVFNSRPDAHPSFALQFGMWRKIANSVCPEDWKDTNGGLGPIYADF